MNKGYKLWQVIVIVISSAIITSVVTGGIIYSGGFSKKQSYPALLQDENIRNFLDAYNEVISGYYEDIDKKKIIDGAIDGMLSNLDEAYTTYMNKDDAGKLIGSLNETYTGIGIVISNNKVISLVMGSPAEKAGILENDMLLKIDDIDVSQMDNSEITALIKAKDKINVEIQGDNQILTYNLETKTINVPNISYKIVENTDIGYMQLNKFSSSIGYQFENILARLERLNMKKLIIDVRGNSGGYLTGASDILGLFLEKNKVMYYIEEKNQLTAFKDKNNTSKDIPVVVLINSGSASASEILAASLKDSYGATLVGTTSFGKGKVQHTKDLSDGSLMKYTSARWLRPNKECIDTIGITPDYVIENDLITDIDENNNEYVKEIIDNQLNKAIEILTNT